MRAALRLLLLILPFVSAAQQGGPVIGTIEIYGTHRVPAAEIRKVLGVAEGSPLPKSKSGLEEQIAEIESVLSAHLEAACCEAGKAILYVGVEERGAPRFDYHAEPVAEDVVAPEAVLAAYRAFVEAVRDAGRSGSAVEDLSRGHSLLADPKARYIQLGFTGLAEGHGAALRRVLRESANPEHRAIAAYVLGYAKDKTTVHDALQAALRDPDSAVRGNAMRALAALAVYSRKNPTVGLKVSPTWLIEMLNSVVWTDKNNAAVALVTLSESRDRGLLDHIAERALPSVLEMARWKHLPHALPAFILAGRIAGLPEEAIQDAWNKEQREGVLKAVAGKR